MWRCQETLLAVIIVVTGCRFFLGDGGVLGGDVYAGEIRFIVDTPSADGLPPPAVDCHSCGLLLTIRRF